MPDTPWGDYYEYSPAGSAQTLFAANGGMAATMARFALAAYHLGPHESLMFNSPDDEADIAFYQLFGQVRWLEYTDFAFEGVRVPALFPKQVRDEVDFPTRDLLNGVFIHENAALIVGRTVDALFISFRGTNDSDTGLIFTTPDTSDWRDMSRHYSYFANVIECIEAYVAQNPGVPVYVTGHSLGAAMAERFMADHPGAQYRAVVFGSPGYGSQQLAEDARVTTVWMEGDFAQIGQLAAGSVGVERWIGGSVHTPEGLDLSAFQIARVKHWPELYEQYMQFFGSWSDGLLDGRFTRAIADVTVTDYENRVFEIGLGNNHLLGLVGNEVMFGGDGSDVLFGAPGDDTLIGGDDEGIDTASYLFNSSEYVVVLGSGVVQVIHVADGRDTLIGIEQIQFQDGVKILPGSARVGTPDADTMDGTADTDYLSGAGGNDNLSGGGGSDLLSGDDGDDIVSGGDGDDTIVGGSGAGNDAYDGGDGDDTVSYPSASLPIVVDLQAGTASGSQIGTDTLANIENIIGGSGSDQLSGNAVANAILAGAGNDTVLGRDGADMLFGEDGNDALNGGNHDDVLVGGAGADALAGGNGTDTADYSSSGAAVNVNLNTGFAAGGDAAGDTFVSIENLTGSAYNDMLIGRDLFLNVLAGGAGDDTLAGGVGADLLHGGDGVDTLDYSLSPNAVDVRLFNGSAAGGSANGDTYTSIENIRGSSKTDTLAGDAGANTMWGGIGNETITGREGADTLYGETGNDTLLGGADEDWLIGGIGADTLGGGAGDDTADYSGSDAAVTINLQSGAGSGGHAQGDTLVSIENVIGSAFNDVIAGKNNAWDNVFDGRGGDDTLTGGLGNDTFVIRNGEGNDTITDFSAGAASGDAVQISGFSETFDTFDELIAAATQHGANVVFDLGNGQTLTLNNVTLGNLNAGDFLFA